MRIEFAEQYGVPCIALEGGEDYIDVMSKVTETEATYFDGEDHCAVVQFPGRPPELYTAEALLRSLPDGEAQWLK